MRGLIVGTVLLLAGLASIAIGVLKVPTALALAQRVWSPLAFVVAITVVTELSAAAGLFRFVAERTTRWGRGRAWLLWLLVVALAVTATIFLSLDTTAVLLTPVVVLVAHHVGLPPLPFALTTVWMANTASLLLPVSNLTNLLAQHELGGYRPADFAALMLAPSIVAMVVPLVWIFVFFRRDLARRYTSGAIRPSTDRVLLVSSAVTVSALLPLLVTGVPVWIPTGAAALVLIVLFRIRQQRLALHTLVPWRLLMLAAGLFLVVQAGHSLGLGALLASAAGGGDTPLDLLRLSGAGALGANAINNLPAYLALEPIAGDPVRLAALLIGVNVGPLLTPWASLATLLWHERLVALGVTISWGRYLLFGLAAAPVTVVCATLALAAWHPVV